MSRIALFGGAFDPPHIGHQAVTLHLLACHDVDEVWWVPSMVHAFGKRMAAFEHRLGMCERALRPFAPGRVQLCSVERDLPPPQHTVDTVDWLTRQHPGHTFCVVIGSDNLADLERWKDVDRLRLLARILVLPRAGHSAGALLPEVSSSAVRQRLRDGASTEAWLDHEVALYIAAHSLYKVAAGGTG
ncbi:MAG: nicotinate-nucleotide adenylyltransferase [Pseudomonadota bacterium]